jgi:hypothetical protein
MKRVTMNSVIRVEDFSVSGWRVSEDDSSRARWYCERLEEGDIVSFSAPPFALSDTNRSFLLGVRQRDSAHHKNVSYKPDRDRVSGFRSGSSDAMELRRVMRRYSESVADFVGKFLLPYSGHWRLDFASFRPLEEENRNLPINKRNDLLHVDSFPTRPSNGDRILRVFTNLHPDRPRVWITSDPFPILAEHYARAAGVATLAAKAKSSPWRELRRVALRTARRLGLPAVDRPLYDEFMLHFHDFLKTHQGFQRDCPKLRTDFAPGSTWMVFTDEVPHAVLSGQFALEQTLIISRDALLEPEKAPYRVLEKMAGVSVVD